MNDEMRLKIFPVLFEFRQSAICMVSLLQKNRSYLLRLLSRLFELGIYNVPDEPIIIEITEKQNNVLPLNSFLFLAYLLLRRMLSFYTVAYNEPFVFLNLGHITLFNHHLLG